MRMRVLAVAAFVLMTLGVLLVADPAEARVGNGNGSSAIGRIDRIEVVPSANPDDPLGTTLRVSGWAIDPTSTDGQVLISGSTKNVVATFGYPPGPLTELPWRIIGRATPIGADGVRTDIPRPIQRRYGADHGFDVEMIRPYGPQVSAPYVTGRPTQVCLEILNVIRDGNGGSTSTRSTTMCKTFHLPRWATTP